MIGATEASVDEGVRLSPQETAEGRGFTDPARTVHDLAAVGVDAAGVRRRVADAPAGPRPLVVEAREPDGRAHRAIVCDTARLGDGRDLAWVGFFAVKRRDVDAAPLGVRDDELIQEFPAHPGILSYSSLELARRRLGQPDPPRRGRRPRALASERAARPRGARARAPATTPTCGSIWRPRGRRARGAKPILRRTKYYDYRDAITWRAEREWPA